ncbi:hypothetical protein ACFPVY_00535 [Flavobacterium qiangtangense]|uniref:Lipoprotein n=1 Tax=Flavobacterium qiangtangense TaxID=1442595 RepID=A0ABW1PJ68_9FLAO
MKKYTIKNYHFLFLAITLISISSCHDVAKKEAIDENTGIETAAVNVVEEIAVREETGKKIADFIPEGYKIFEEIHGDLNNDQIEDCVVIIKRTNKENFVVDEYRGELDRNRRGIIVLLKKGQNYVLASKNYDCFSSENEEGGAYYAPELSVEIKKGKIYVHYAHGRYGFWSYTFRIKNNDFDLIGYDSSNNFGPRVDSEISINFLTKKKITKTNTNPEGEGGDEVFEEVIENIKLKKPLKLSEIKDFDELEV